MAAASAPAPPVRSKLASAWEKGGLTRVVRSRDWPPIVVSLLFLAVMAWFIRGDLRSNDGHLIYSFDDPYGHMAIAKHLVRSGVWGFSVQGGFASGGSSVIWPLLLAAWYLVAGVNDYAPLALNVIAVVATVFYVSGMIRRYTGSGVVNLFILAVLVFLMPLSALVFSGLEHPWQILADVIFFDLVSRVLADGERPESATCAARWLPMAAFFLSGMRYEGLFLLSIAGLLLLCRGRWRQAVVMGAAAALPITVFGLYAMSKGWYFLPNSLLLKGNVPSGGTWAALKELLGHAYRLASETPPINTAILAMAAALVAAVSRHRTFWNRPALLLIITLGALAQHVALATAGGRHRHEAYLMAMSLVSVGMVVADGLPSNDPATGRLGRKAYLTAVAFAGVLFGIPWYTQAVAAYRLTLPGCHNVYEQQFFMGRFLHDYYRDKGVAANDIGAIDFYANIDLVDTWGLGTMEVARAKRAGTYDVADLQRLFARHNVRVIAVYDSWATQYGGQSPEWVPVGQWTIPNNRVCGDATVSFYAPTAGDVPRLITALQKFSPQLPRDVVQAGAYVGGPWPHAVGTYMPDHHSGPGEVSYWSKQRATFYLAPLEWCPQHASDTATLIVPVTPMSSMTGMDIILNGETIASRPVQSGDLSHSVPWSMKVRWRHGYNTLCIAARGQAAWSGSSEFRPFLFNVGEPQWNFDTPPAPLTTP